MKYSLEHVERIVQDHCASSVERFIDAARADGIADEDIEAALETYGEIVQETRREIRAFARGDEPA